jgi:Domain of unknown function (DUF4382)
MFRPVPHTIFPLALATLMTACGGGGGSDVTLAASTGELNLGITDAAVDEADKVLVQFAGVEAKPASGPAETMDLEGDSQTCADLLDGIDPSPTPEGEPTVRCIDLLALQGSTTSVLLRDEAIPAGDYNWMRLDVHAERGVMDSIIVLKSGAEESLWIPSGSQSGLKLNGGFRILAGQTNNLVIDFDLRKSVNDPQGFADYRLKPSLRLLNLDDEGAGSIVGTVEASLLGGDECTEDAYAVYVYAGADATIGDEGSEDAPLTSATVSLDGESGLWSYEAAFLAPGEYTVAFTCEAGNDTADVAGDELAFVESADSPTTVVDGEESIVDFVE